MSMRGRVGMRLCGVAICVAGVAMVLLLGEVKAEDAPKTMTKVTVKLIEPKAEEGSFDDQPKTLWRAGTKYSRIAEAPDTTHHIRGLMIVHEPDAWIINMFDRSGTHVVDAGPTFNVQLPIFATGEEQNKVRDLQFGKEMEFFSKAGAKKSEGERLNGKETQKYEAAVEGGTAILWTDAKSNKPVQVSLVEAKGTKTFMYLEYEDGLAFDARLFEPPPGVAIVEMGKH